MNESGDLANVETFVTKLIATLKADAGGIREDSPSGLFPKGVDFISMKINDGHAKVDLIVSGSSTPPPIVASPVRPDRVVQPMLVNLPLTQGTEIESINIIVEITYLNGQKENKVFPNFPMGRQTNIQI